MQKKLGKNKFLDDFEGVFEKKISRFIWAICHIKLNPAIYMNAPLCVTFKCSRAQCALPLPEGIGEAVNDRVMPPVNLGKGWRLFPYPKPRSLQM